MLPPVAVRSLLKAPLGTWGICPLAAAASGGCGTQCWHWAAFLSMNVRERPASEGAEDRGMTKSLQRPHHRGHLETGPQAPHLPAEGLVEMKALRYQSAMSILNLLDAHRTSAAAPTTASSPPIRYTRPSGAAGSRGQPVSPVSCRAAAQAPACVRVSEGERAPLPPSVTGPGGAATRWVRTPPMKMPHEDAPPPGGGSPRMRMLPCPPHRAGHCQPPDVKEHGFWRAHS